MRYPSGAFGERCRWTVPAAGPPTGSDGSSARCAERRLARACPNCSTLNGPTARFCGECGSALGPDGPSAGPSAATSRAGDGAVAVAPPARAVEAGLPVAERRLVSVLFADLVGFTTLAEGRDAEAVRELLTRYFDLAREVIGALRRHRREVHRRRGHGRLGRADAHEDDAERAVRAALDLVDAVRDARRTRSRSRPRGRRADRRGRGHPRRDDQGMVAGDLVNTASRLQSVAPPGTVLVGEATQRAAAQRDRLRAGRRAGPQGQGRAGPGLARAAGRGRARRRAVGRTRSRRRSSAATSELRLLKDLFHATAASAGRASSRSSGQAGIGKSRLAWEFQKYIDGAGRDVYWHQGRSPAYGEGITFWALGEMVRSRAGIAEGDDEPTTRARSSRRPLAEYVAGRGRAALDRAALLRPARPRGARRRRARGAVRGAGGRSSSGSPSTAPTVLVFEDLHWADDGLLDFIDHLARVVARPSRSSS